MLILVFGLPGTGKTTFARALAGALEAEHLNSDIIRSILGKRGQYDASAKESVYEEMMEKTAGFLNNGKTVVVDATFYKKDLRRKFVELAKNVGVKHAWIMIAADEEIVKKRVANERPDSEADYPVYRKIKAVFEPLKEKHLHLRSDKLSVSAMVKTTMDFLSIDNEGKL